MDQNNKQPAWMTGKAPEPNKNKNWIGIISLVVLTVVIYNLVKSDPPKKEVSSTDATQQVIKFPVAKVDSTIKKITPAEVLANDDAGEMLRDTDIHISRMDFLLRRASYLYKQPADSLAYKTYNLKKQLHKSGVAVSNQEILEYIKGFGKAKDVSYEDALKLYYIYKLN